MASRSTDAARAMRADGGVVRVAPFSPYYNPNVVVVRGRKLQQTADCKTVVELLGETGDLSKLRSLQASMSPKLTAELQSKGGQSFTLFAPNNAAFDKLMAALPRESGSMMPEDVLKNETAITAILSYHIVPGVAALSSDLSNGQQLPTALGSKVAPLKVKLDAGKVTIQGVGSEAMVVKPDIKACRGVVHIIDEVLLPVKGDGSSTA